MRVTKLQLHGFKSFFHRTTLDLPPGVSAVVGPNGCGKSNIADAVRWVMGEQSPSRLRGKGMEDLIFAGSQTSKQLGRAEVSLSLCRTRDPFPAPFHPYDELTVTRRLYRSGESEYLINNVPCRLKDIVHLFMDTGLGNRGYAIIEQGSISRIIDSRPEERRSWVEEAAGIVKFKAQRQSALSKLDQTNHNLERVNDIMAEVDRQARAMKRQATIARRHRELTAEIKALDLALAAARYDELSGQIRRQSDRERELNQAKESLISREAEFNAQVENIRLELAKEERVLGQYNEQRHTLRSQIQALEQRQVHLKEKQTDSIRRREQDLRVLEDERERLEELNDEAAQLAQRREEIGGHLGELEAVERNLGQRLDQAREEAGLKAEAVSRAKDDLINLASQRAQVHNTLLSARERLDRLGAQGDRLDDQAGKAEHERDEINAGLADDQARLEAVAAELEDLAAEEERVNEALDLAAEELNLAKAEASTQKGRIQKVSGRLDGLEALTASHEGLGHGVKALLERDDAEAGVYLGLIAQGVRASQEVEPLVEAALAGGAEHLLARDNRSATEAIRYLTEHRSGLAGLMSSDLLPEIEDFPPPAGADRLIDLIEFIDPIGPAAKALLADCLVVDDLDRAFEVWQDCRGKRVVLARQGGRIDRAGVIIGGRAEKDDFSLLARQRRIRELRQELAELTGELDRLEEQADRAEERVEMFRQEAAELTGRTRQAEQESTTIDKSVAQHNFRLAELDRLDRVLTDERGRIKTEIDSLRSREKDYAAKLETVEAEKAKVEAQLDRTEAEATQAADQAAKLQDELIGQKVVLSGLRQQNQDLDRQESRISRDRDRTMDRIVDLEERISQAGEDAGQFIDQARLVERELKELTDQVQDQDERVGAQQERVSQRQEELTAKQAEVKAVAAELRGLDEEIHQINLAVNQTRMNRDHLIEDVRERYQLDLPANKNAVTDPELNLSDAKIDLEQLKIKLTRLGPVNPTAVEEYQALVERRDFLQEQIDDLTASMDDLKAAIRKINKTSVERFMETFRVVGNKLKEVSPILFGESGRVEMVLLDPNDPLESGIELKVQPPGKRLVNMGLLSGGEKALAAASLLFSIFLHRPSPFCLLDEVDAPLDENNVDRFNQLLKEIGRQSQILMITHNRRTMEVADTLYGVTMPEPGISRLVSVRLDETDRKQETEALL